MKTKNSGLAGLFTPIFAGLCALLPLPAPALVVPVHSDAMLVSGSDVNYGRDKTIVIGDGRTLLVKFGDLAPWLPAGTAGADIQKATFQFYVKTWNDVAATLKPTAILDDWRETAVTGTTALERRTGGNPSGSPASQAIDGAGHWYALDVTELFKDWLRAGGVSSFELSAGEGLQVAIESRENAQSGYAPFLDVTLTSGSGIQCEKGDRGPVGPQGPAGPEGPKGDKGDKGNSGPQGEQGPAGPRGIQGLAGTILKTISTNHKKATISCNEERDCVLQEPYVLRGVCPEGYRALSAVCSTPLSSTLKVNTDVWKLDSYNDNAAFCQYEGAIRSYHEEHLGMSYICFLRTGPAM